VCIGSRLSAGSGISPPSPVAALGGEAAWRSAIAMGSGVLFVVLVARRRRAQEACRKPTACLDAFPRERVSDGEPLTGGQFSAVVDKVRANATQWEGRRRPATGSKLAVPPLASSIEIR
jgi:hypothetical protein